MCNPGRNFCQGPPTHRTSRACFLPFAPEPGARLRGLGTGEGGMAREPEEEDPAGVVSGLALALLARPARTRVGGTQTRTRTRTRTPWPPFWLLCLVACWLLGAQADADFSILDEAQVLASQMQRLSAEELGVVTMQVSAPPQTTHPQTGQLLFLISASGPFAGSRFPLHPCLLLA